LGIFQYLGNNAADALSWGLVVASAAIFLAVILGFELDIIFKSGI